MYCIDVSDNNKIDIRTIKNENDLVYIKATEGRSYVNKDLDKQYRQAREAGYKIGFYHYAWNHPEEESKFFKDVISKYSYDLMPCIDIEEPSIKNSLDADSFITKFSAGFGGVNKMLIYTGLSYYHEKINKITGANMWIAAYGQSKPTLRDNKLLMWQYTDKAYGTTDRSEVYKVPYITKTAIDSVKIANDYLKGDSNKIKKVQMILQMLGYKFNKIDGVCGSKTVSYIGQLQKELGLNVDYCFGPHTMSKALDLLKKKW